jgi:hypothetical protein
MPSPILSTVPGRRPGWSRRKFLTSLAQSSAAAAAFSTLSPVLTYSADTNPASSSRRKRVALIATHVRKYAHAQHFIDRLLEGYGWQGAHHRPPLELVSMYVDQFPGDDLSRDRERRHGAKIFPTVSEALTLGGSKLAVDGVLIIGEHGKYPRNAKGQTLYPRYKFFKEIVKVFEGSGRSVPVFNDKHLSTDWKESTEMVEDAKRLGFAFLAGSSLPVTWRIPSLEIPLDTPMEESVSICYGGVDSYDFHGLETAQCMSERRAGGEVGVRSVHAVRGAKIWELLADRDITKKLLFAALARSHTFKAPPGYTCSVPNLDWIKRSSPDAVAYFIEHLDGFKTTMFLLNGALLDFNYAGQIKGSKEIVSCQMHLPMPPRQTTLADFFNPLMNHVEQTFLSGVASYPIERCLLTTGMTLFAVESLYRGQVRLLTPEMQVSYKAPSHSTYWRA